MDAAQRPIGFWLKLVDRMIDEQFDGVLEEHGVTRRQWQLLNVLSRGPASLEQLDAAVAPFLSPDGESSAEHLAELVESGWLVLNDTHYTETERGAASFQRLSGVVADIRERVTEGLTADQYVTTVASLERMAANLGWIDDSDE